MQVNEDYHLHTFFVRICVPSSYGIEDRQISMQTVDNS